MQAKGTGSAFFRTGNGGYGTQWQSGNSQDVTETPLYKELVSVVSCMHLF